MAWTTIPPARLAPDAVVLSVDALAFYDNPIAIANGDAGAPQIQTAGIEDGAVTTAKMDAERLHVFKFSAVSDGTGANWNNVVLDATLDWRNRFIVIPFGRLFFGANSGAVSPYIVGSGVAGENQIGFSYKVPGNNTGCDFAWQGLVAGGYTSMICWMYSNDGGAAYTNDPNMSAMGQEGGVATIQAYIWVNSANGSLNLTWHKSGVNYDWAAINLMAVYTEVI
jgi:hypothetical protein